MTHQGPEPRLLPWVRPRGGGERISRLAPPRGPGSFEQRQGEPDPPPIRTTLRDPAAASHHRAVTANQPLGAVPAAGPRHPGEGTETGRGAAAARPGVKVLSLRMPGLQFQGTTIDRGEWMTRPRARERARAKAKAEAEAVTGVEMKMKTRAACRTAKPMPRLWISS